MGSAGKVMTKLAKSVGVVEEVPQPRQLAEKKAGNYGRKARRGQTPLSPHWASVIAKWRQISVC